MRAIPQLVLAPSNPIPIVEHFRWSHPQCEHSYGQEMLINVNKDNNAIQMIQSITNGLKSTTTEIDKYTIRSMEICFFQLLFVITSIPFSKTNVE